MSTHKISEDIKKQVEEIVAAFNQKILLGKNSEYRTRYKGKHLYLDRYDYGSKGQICRLEYTGEMEKWEFAIFKYSSGTYDPDEWMFPGSGLVDGTIEGAMKAGLETYS
jgi:hypothetical protein